MVAEVQTDRLGGVIEQVRKNLERLEAEWAAAGTTLLYTVPALVTALAAAGIRAHGFPPSPSPQLPVRPWRRASGSRRCGSI